MLFEPGHGTEAAYRLSPGHGHTRTVPSEHPRFEFVQMADSVDARLFIEMSSHAADLVEARHSLEAVLRHGAQADSPLAGFESALIAAATVAYCRTFFDSKVRRPMTELIELPDALRETHELVRVYRNRTVAHSQSELAVTYAVAVLDAETLEARDVTATTISSPMPTGRVRDFLRLVTTVQDLLDDAIEPIRHRLLERIAAVDRAALVREGVRPMIREMLAASFNPSATRAAYPTSHPIYLSRDVAD